VELKCVDEFNLALYSVMMKEMIKTYYVKFKSNKIKFIKQQRA